MIALAVLLVALLLALFGILSTPETRRWAAVLGVGLLALGFGIVLIAQLDMGISWRVGVDPSEEVEFVQRGLFRIVRNPIYSGLGLFALGLALLVPNALSLLALVSGAVGLELQVRYVEEPLLLARLGESYRGYARRVGRFLPWIGRLGEERSPVAGR